MTTETPFGQMEPQKGNEWHNGNPAALSPTVEVWERAVSPDRAIDAWYLRDYYQAPYEGRLTARDILTNDTAAVTRAAAARRKFSLQRSLCDSYCAMVVQVPSIDVTTVGGTYPQRRSAELLGGWVDGVFVANRMEATTWKCVVDSFFTRVAGVLVEADIGCAIRVTRVLPHLIRWNPAEGESPANLSIGTPVSLAALKRQNPDKAAALDRAPSYVPDPLFAGIDGYSPEVMGDLVLLERAWHLGETGDTKENTHGRYVATVGDIVIANDPYPHTEFPFVPLRFDWSYATFAGKPAADTLDAYQQELDEFTETIRDQFGKSAMRIYVDSEANVDPKTLDATVQGRVVVYQNGKKPETDRGSAPPPEFLQREQQIIQRAHDFLGLSYDAARGVKADGIASGKGQREVAALAQNRQILRMKTVQNWLVDVGRAVVRVADDTYKNKDAVVKAPGTRTLRRIKWSDINYDKDQFELRCDAINALSRHPAARVDEVLELVQAKVLEPRAGLKALGNKDLEFVRDQAFATEDYVERMIDLALRGKPLQPEPYLGPDGLQTMLSRAQQRYLAESVEDEPSEHLSFLRDLIESTKALLDELQAKPPANTQTDISAPPAMPPGPPGAGPPPGPADLQVGGAGLPASLPPAAAAPPVAGQGVAA